MNTLYQKITIAIGLALSLSLVSCQKDSLVTPDSPVVSRPEETPAINDWITPLLGKYTLIRYGTGDLTYKDNRLYKSTPNMTMGGQNSPYFTYYTYSAVSRSVNDIQIKATGYQFGTQAEYENTYIVNSDGRCYESKYVSYAYPNGYGTPGIVAETKTWVYQYNEAGQLATWSNKNNGLERSVYTFDGEGDLVKVTIYGPTGIALKRTTLDYGPTNDNQLDKCPQYSSWSGLPDRHLKIFGSRSKHLLKGIVQMKLLTNQVLFSRTFSYTLNADGYVAFDEERDVLNPSLFLISTYDYLGVHPTYNIPSF
jgi:hypothetical protein